MEEITAWAGIQLKFLFEWDNIARQFVLEFRFYFCGRFRSSVLWPVEVLCRATTIQDDPFDDVQIIETSACSCFFVLRRLCAFQLWIWCLWYGDRCDFRLQ